MMTSKLPTLKRPGAAAAALPSLKRPSAAAAALVALCATFSVLALAPALAAAPTPRKAVEARHFLGHWFEIARTPNSRENACVTAAMAFEAGMSGRYALTQTCRKASGAVQTVKAGARFAEAGAHTRLDVSFFGGLITSHYVVLDHDADYRWAIVCTSGGRYVWLLARTAQLAPDQRQAAETALRSLGFEPKRLQFAGV
jgi:apolipoprotein D and lipocalin family protein